MRRIASGLLGLLACSSAHALEPENTLADWRAATPAERRAFVELWTGVAQKNGFTAQSADDLAVCLQRLQWDRELARVPLIQIAALCVTENE